MLGATVALIVGVVAGIAITALVMGRRSEPGSVAAPTSSGQAARTGSADIGRHDTGTTGVSDSLRDAVDHLAVGVMVSSPVGKVRYRNDASRVFEGTHVGILLDDHVAALVMSTQGGLPTSTVVELHGPPRVWLEISAHPLPNGGAVATIRDVGERVRTDAMRTDFVTNISHELKTPVGAVAVLAEALIEEQDPAVIARLADHLVEEAHRAVRTIDDLLKLSEIESTGPGDDIVDLMSVVIRAISRGRAVDGGIEITTLDMPAGLSVRGDERQLVSAVGNLVENAVKYSRPGGVVQIRTRADDVWVEVMVVDQGVGIPRRDLDRVFERFYRVDRARSRTTGGTGLGLAIVRHVADNHGGEVVVSSQEGEGSTFVLRLPASLMVAADVARADGAEAST